MRIVIPLCRHCSNNPDECEHRAALRKAVRGNGSNVTVIHNCTVYPTLWKPGDKVWVDIKAYRARYFRAIRPEEGMPEDEHWEGEWVDASPQQGTIVKTTSKKFFVVEFDQAITVSRPKGEGSWGEAEDIEVETLVVYGSKLHREKPEAK